MPGNGGLSRRRVLAEVMDRPDLEAGQHVHALRGLERINRLSLSSRILWPPVRQAVRDAGRRAVRLLDLASGAGDVPIALEGRARRRGLPLEVAGCDRSARAVAYATERGRARGAGVRFFVADVVAEGVPAGYDVLTCSLFLHHLEDGAAERLLADMGRKARRMVLVNDLCRGVGGYLLAWVGTRCLSTSAVVRVDGPRSVEAALTVAEARALAGRAGLIGATVERRWPCRFLLAWKRSS